MKYIIDRLEEEMAVCENESREMIPIPLKELPPGAQEGDVILEQEGVFCVVLVVFKHWYLLCVQMLLISIPQALDFVKSLKI